MRRPAAGLLILLALGSGSAVGWAAEAPDQHRATPQTTQLILKLASEELVSVDTKFQEDPPTILIQFPSRRIIGTLPESSVIGQGAVQSVETVYAASKSPTDRRWIQELRIHLRGHYGYQVRSESGRIIVEVEHPADIAGETVEVGLGGVILSSAAPQGFSERFQAMEQALKSAMPKPRIGEATSGAPAAGSTSTTYADDSQPAAPSSQPPAVTVETPPPPSSRSGQPSAWPWAGLASFVALGVWWGGRRGWWQALTPKIPWWPQRRPLSSDRIAPEVRIVDQLVWRAFERKGFQLLQMLELENPIGLMRLMAKDGRKAALVCIGDGLFFEKTVVDEFQQAMRHASAQEGFIVAPGSFTVPAQRLAKEHDISLIGREQLIELLSEGAVNEHFSKQLHQLHDQVHQAKITLEEYARQLETLRRQRNEATWFLGEERTKSSSLQTQVDELTRQVGEWQAQAKQWQEAAELTRRQWEESQWYLGEARAAIAHLEDQLKPLHEAYAELDARHQELAARLQDAERQRNEAQWFLGESRAACDMLKQETQRLAEQLQTTQGGLEETKRMVEHYRRLAEGQERRRALRLSRSGIRVHVQGRDGAVLFEGTPRDVSTTGIGLAMSDRLPDGAEPLQLRVVLPGSDEPFRIDAKTVWQRADDGAALQISGHEFIPLAADDRHRLQRAIAQLAAPSD